VRLASSAALERHDHRRHRADDDHRQPAPISRSSTTPNDLNTLLSSFSPQRDDDRIPIRIAIHYKPVRASGAKRLAVFLP
jgi:hypothetical protein